MIHIFTEDTSANREIFKKDELKDFLRIIGNSEDSLLEGLMQSAINSFEAYTGKILISHNMKLVVKNFTAQALIFPVQPVRKINKIELVDYYENKTEFNKKFYKLDPVTSIIHFVHQPLCSNIVIDFNVGLAEKPEEISDEIKIALFSHIAFLYLNRGNNQEFNLNIYKKFKTIKL